MNISVERSVLRGTAKKVAQEMDEYAKKHKTEETRLFQSLGNKKKSILEEYLVGIRWNYLNNFHLNLYGGIYRKYSEDLGILDTTHREYFLDYDLRNAGKLKTDLSPYSDRYLSQTPRDFFEIVDRVTKMKRISQGRIVALRQSGALKDLCRLVLRVYIHLDALGYNHPELTD